MTEGVSRRALLALLSTSGLAASVPAPPASKSKPLPRVGEFVRLVDPETENVIVRLTNLASASFLPDPSNRFVSVRERFLIFSSDRTGTLSPFQVDLRTGVLRQLGAPNALKPASLCLDDKEKELYYVDGTDLNAIGLTNHRGRVLTGGVGAFALVDAPASLVLVREAKALFVSGTGKAAQLMEGVAPFCLLRSDKKGCLFVRERGEEREFWYVPISSGSNPEKPVCLAGGRISRPFWSPDNSALTFLREVATPTGNFAEIWEVPVTGGPDRKVAPTSQFATFAPNEDGSVFVGASRSKAQPNVVIMLRNSHRELTLCEHKAKNPSSVSPVFSPDSRRVYFQSDHEGKSAVYSVNVELLVEPTASS